MTEGTSSNDTIITDIVDNDISIVLEKLSILSDKSSSNDVPNKESEKLSNETIDIFKSLIISAIETIRDKSKRPDIDAIYRHISKSEATNVDRDFIASVLNDLENQNVIYNKPTTQGLHSYFIASHTDKKDPKNIKSQAQNDNTQSDPESNLFSNQPGHDLVSPDDTTPIVNSTVTTSNTKEFSNIKTHKHITVDKAFSLEDEVQFIYSTVTTPAKENDINFKSCENNDLNKHISKLEARLSAIKRYINCEVSILTNKIESISNDFEKRITTLLGKEKSKSKILQQNMTLLQSELLPKNEIIKSLIEIQSSILYIYYYIILYILFYIVFYILYLNVNVTIDDNYEVFGLKTTKYMRSNTYVEMPLNRNGQTRGFAFVTAPGHVRNELIKLNNIQFREKNLIIQAARSKMKTAKTIAKSNHSTRPSVVVNHFPEHQDVFNGSKLVPGELSYNNAVKSAWLNSGKQNRIIIFGDSIFRGIRFREFNNEIKSGYAKFKTFLGADSKEILHYVNPTLESGNYDSAAFHFGVNDLLQKTISKSDSVENLVENIRKTAVKCMSHGVSKVFVSVIVRNKRIPESLLEEVNEKVSFMCENNSFIFVDNSNISNIHLFDDGLHLVESGRCI